MDQFANKYMRHDIGKAIDEGVRRKQRVLCKKIQRIMYWIAQRQKTGAV